MMDTIHTPDNYTETTVSAELDRLEVPAGKIGLVDAAQALELIKDLDAVYDRIQEMEPGLKSRRLAQTQFDGIVARLHAEAAQFLRDLGGAEVLRQERERRNPPEERTWWYIDVHLANKRKAMLKRGLVIGGITLAVLAALLVIYNTFLAPDPTVAAIYAHENAARDRLLEGEWQAAAEEVDQALAIDPQEPSILVLKGVIQDALGEPEAAAETYALAEQILGSRENLLILRGQAYMYASMTEKSLADAEEAIKINPNSAQGYLMRGQAHEMLGDFEAAADDYDLAFAAAEKTGQTELAAIARTRLAMLIQSMGGQLLPSELAPTAEP